MLIKDDNDTFVEILSVYLISFLFKKEIAPYTGVLNFLLIFVFGGYNKL